MSAYSGHSARVMELKLNNELPVVEGLIVKGGSKEFILDIGKDAGIKSGMKLIVYDLCDSVVHPNSGQLIGRDFVEIGQARIQSVYGRDVLCVYNR